MLYVLVSTGFQVLFHSPPGVLFTFPSQYFSTIGHRVIFRLGWWSTLLPTGFLVSRGTPDTPHIFAPFAYVTLTLFGMSSHTFQLKTLCYLQSSTPEVFLPQVWPLTRSLATTCVISFDFFSSPYLDVSVQAVPLIYLFYSVYDTYTLLYVSSLIQTSRFLQLFASPPGFSQLIASFVGSRCQGILPALFLA